MQPPKICPLSTDENGLAVDLSTDGTRRFGALVVRNHPESPGKSPLRSVSGQPEPVGGGGGGGTNGRHVTMERDDRRKRAGVRI